VSIYLVLLPLWLVLFLGFIKLLLITFAILIAIIKVSAVGLEYSKLEQEFLKEKENTNG